jgi:ABC-type multidrug transport system permease subunit
MNTRWTALIELTSARIREFFREPAAIFWVYGFPLIMALSLGIAFRDRPQAKLNIDLVAPGGDTTAPAWWSTLQEDPRLTLHTPAPDAWTRRLRDAKTDLVLVAPGMTGSSSGSAPPSNAPPSNATPSNATPSNETPSNVTASNVTASNGVAPHETSAGGPSGWQVWSEPRRADSLLAREVVENVLHRQTTAPPPNFEPRELQEAGSRYIDFLIPGLLGMNLMGGGLFGVGFVLVDMRVKKLLKRFLATPLRHGDFLLSVMLSRLLFMLPEILALLLFSRFLFGVTVRGSYGELALLVLLGGFCFAGIGLLVASRATTLETASGLMNLLMLPMYVLSGVFFSADRFPEAMQPLVRALPLTALNDALRGVMLEGESLVELSRPCLTLVLWGVLSFAVALRIFRWK